MKLRKGFIVGIVSLLGATALAGCWWKKEGAKKELTKVNVSGIQRTYEPGDTIPWDALRVTATFSDSSTETFTKFEYDVESVASSETQAVIYTSGLHSQSAVEEGVYAISVAVPSDLSTKYQAGNISVGNATPDNYALVEYSDPSLKTGYAANIKDAGTEIEPERNNKETAKANENKFISDKTQYVVGTLNPFIFEPEVSFENILDPTADLITGDDIHFRKDYEIRVKVENEYVDAPAVDYSIVDGYVKFNESAVGKTFSLKVSLHDFDKVEGTTKKAESTFEGFTVQKGLNIYNAKQLGILNITKLSTQQLADAQYNEHKGDTDNMFWNGTDYYRPRLNELWANYLVNSGTFTSEELQAYADTPAIFLHRKLEIKPTDLPSDYFIKAGELAGDHIVGCLRDSVPLYAAIVGDSDVEINGNFWTVDTTALPLCKNERSNNGPVEYTEGKADQVIMPGHLVLFKFCGIDSDDNSFFNEQVLRSTGKGIIRNVNSIGNTGTDLVSQDFDKMLTLTGLIFGKNDYCPALYENCIIKQYQIGVFADNMIGQAVGDKPQTDYTFVKDLRVYDCANSGLFNYHNGGVHVSKSVFNRFGAAPLMNAGSEEARRAPNTKFTPDVIFNNEITGEEIYFSALGATEAVGTIKGFNPFFVALGNQFVYKNDKNVDVMNLVSIGINGDDYLDADSPNYSSNIYLNAGAANELRASVQSNTNQWMFYSNLRGAIYEQVFEGYWASVVQQHDAAYAQAWGQAQQTHAAYEQVAKITFAKNLLVQQYGGTVDDYTDEQAAQLIAATDGFDTLFDQYARPTFEAEFEAGAGFAFNEESFSAYFEAGFEASQGFKFDKAEFRKFFDANYGATVDANIPQPPVFQTEVASELFWTDLEKLYSATGSEFTAQLEGNYLHLLVPVGSTCLSLTFRIGKLPVQA